LKTERGNTVRALNSLNLPPGSPNTGSVVDADSDNDAAIASGAMLDPLVTRQSFASTVAAAPKTAPRAERAAGANEFVRKHPLLVVLGIAALVAVIAYYPTENAQSSFDTGEAFLGNNQPEPAIKTFTRAIASNPRMVAAYVERAHAYFQTGASDLALADCRKAIELDPAKPEAYEMRAKIELPPGHFRQVIADLVTVSRIRGTLPPAAMATLGHAYMGDGQYSHALTQFSKKLDRDPDDLQSLVAKAKCYLAMNLPHMAIESCDLAIAKAGNTYDAYVLRGECEDQLNGTAALKDFDKAISLNGQRADAFLSRGLYFAHIRDFTKASHDMDSGLKLPGGIPDGRYKHAMVYALQKDKENALEQFKLLEAKPDFKTDNWFYVQRSDVYAQLQDFKMARADLEKALASDNAYQTACWLRLARCFESEHDYKKAALYAGKVLADEPTNSTALLKHSKYSLLSGNRMTAMDDLYKAIASAPKNPLSYLARGDIYFQDKQYSLADDDYQKAAKLAPLNIEVKKKLIACNEFVKRPKASAQATQDKPVTLSAAALKEIADADLQTLNKKGYEALKSGRADYAVAALTRAIYLNPNNGNARRYLAYALLKTGNTADAAQQFYAWEKIADPDPASSIAFVRLVAAQSDAQTLFEHLAERYRTNAPILLEIARQCAFYHYDSVEGSALDFATKVATSDQQVAINRLRISLDSTSGRSPAPAAVSGGKPITVAN
jgi:tetratricopeptide (TPR) repeat protein